MNARSLLLARVSLGLLMLVWAVDKLVNVAHGLDVVGVGRRSAYPAPLAITGATLLGVCKSVLDPSGWYRDRANVLFCPSLIIFAAGLVLWAFGDENRLGVGRRARAR